MKTIDPIVVRELPLRKIVRDDSWLGELRGYPILPMDWPRAGDLIQGRVESCRS